MAVARLVVVEGPDAGAEFSIPLRGGGLGRGEDGVVVLTDPSVSRTHCKLELRDDRVALVDHGSRNRTLVNGKPVSAHVLDDGDEITVGQSKLVFVAEGGVAVARAPSRMTLEVGSGELLHARDTTALPAADRAERHLAALAALGDTLHRAADRKELARAACDAARAALAADRAFLVARDNGRTVPLAAAVLRGDDALSLPRDLSERVLGASKVVAAEVGPAGRVALAAPLSIAPAEAPTGLLYADRDGVPWDRVDLMAAGCIAHLIAAALAGFDARELLVAENRALSDRLGGGDFVGTSGPAREVLGFVAKVGPSDATVLLTGESGSGKEMVARAVHRASRRQRGAFVAVNCAALTETLIESELFGHEKGAFTGATEKKLGRFEAAHEGTLFLDEVGELPLSCQTKFLRVLEERCVDRVGGTRPIPVDVRVVAATNRDLADMVRRGSFREDLYYRLSVIHTVVPPLRARPGDIPELARHFLSRLRPQVSRRITGFDTEALDALMRHPWPGNVRELRNAIERAIVLGDGELVRAADLPPELLGAAAPMPRPAPTLAPTPPAGVASMPAMPAAPRSLKELERDGIIAALRATGGNKAQAAALLEIDRSTLYKKLKDYDIEL